MDPEELRAGPPARRHLRGLPGAGAAHRHALRDGLRGGLPPAAARARVALRPRLRLREGRDGARSRSSRAGLPVAAPRQQARSHHALVGGEPHPRLHRRPDGDRHDVRRRRHGRRSGEAARRGGRRPDRSPRRSTAASALARRRSCALGPGGLLGSTSSSSSPSATSSPTGSTSTSSPAFPTVYLPRAAAGRRRSRKLDLENEAASSAPATLTDLSWKEVLDIYSCTECGRCQTHCPTYVTGKPLTHKEVNRAVKHHLIAQAPELTALGARAATRRRGRRPAAALPAISAGGPARRPSGPAPPAAGARRPARSSSRTSRGSSTCAATRCWWRPTSPRRRRASSRASRRRGTPGASAATGARSGARTSTFPSPRLRTSGRDFEYLFFVGCAGSFDDRQKKVSRALVKILRAAKRQLRHPRRGGDLQRRLRPAAGERVPVPGAGRRQRRMGHVDTSVIADGFEGCDRFFRSEFFFWI